MSMASAHLMSQQAQAGLPMPTRACYKSHSETKSLSSRHLAATCRPSAGQRRMHSMCTAAAVRNQLSHAGQVSATAAAAAKTCPSWHLQALAEPTGHLLRLRGSQSRWRSAAAAAQAGSDSGSATDTQLCCSSSDDAASSSGSDGAAAPSGDGSVATIQLDMPRRSMQVTFTCDKCGSRSERLVNPIAWNKGLVFAQCRGCDVWHKLRDEAGLIDEIRYIDEDARSGSGQQ